MQNQKKVSFGEKIDQRPVGFLVGLTVPIIVYFIIYFTQYDHILFSEYFQRSIMENTAPLLLRSMVFPNLLFFLIGNMTQKFAFCWGLFASSVLYIVPMLLIKFL